MISWPDRINLWDELGCREAWRRLGRPATVKEQLDGRVVGDTIELLVYPDIPALVNGTSRTITKAWLSVKAKETAVDATENAAWSPTAGARQTISTTTVAGRGQILNSSEGTPELRFDITAANTLLLTARKLYYFDVQVLMSDAALYTVERGTCTFAPGITAATS